MGTKGEHGTVRHVLADGRVLDNIEGYVVPPTGKTEAVYLLLADFILKSRIKKGEDAQSGFQ